MPSVVDVIAEAMRRGKRGEALALSVLNRLGQMGVRPNWLIEGHSVIPDPCWYEGLNKDSSGRALAKRKTNANLARRVIEAYERRLEAESALACGVDPFSSDNGGPQGDDHSLSVPLGTLTALDEESTWDVTAAQRVFRRPFEALLRDLTPMLRSLSRSVRRSCHLEDVLNDDLIQEAYLRIYEKLSSYTGRSSFQSWAYRVARNAMVDEARRVITDRRLYVTVDPTSVGARADDPDFVVQLESCLVGLPALLTLMKTVRGSHLLLLQALGFRDSELSLSNLRMKRHRARTRLIRLLRAEYQLDARAGP